MGSTPHTNIERNSSSGLQSMRATHDNSAILLHTSRLLSPKKVNEPRPISIAVMDFGKAFILIGSKPPPKNINHKGASLSYSSPSAKSVPSSLPTNKIPAAKEGAAMMDSPRSTLQISAPFSRSMA